MIETIAIGALSLTTVGASYKWFMAHMERGAFKALNELLHEDLDEAVKRDEQNTNRIAELIVTNFKLLAEKRRRDAPLIAANAARHAARLEREAKAEAKRNETHAEMRALIVEGR